MFLIEAYKIPTSSMESSLLVGDFLFVSKMNYGIRTPMTVAMVPLLHNTIPGLGTESYLRKPKLPYYRLPALESIDRNECIVFNYPEGDSVYVTPFRNFSVHDLKRNPDLKRDPQLRSYFAKSNLRIRPIDKRDHYIKRCIATPGDTLEIRDRDIYINGRIAEQPSQRQFQYLVKFKTPLNTGRLEEMGITQEDQGSANSNNGSGPNHMLLILTEEQKQQLTEMDPNITIIPNDLYELRVPRGTDPSVIASWGISNAHIRGMMNQTILMTLTEKQIGKIQQADSTAIIRPFNRSEQLFPHDPKHFGDWSTDNYGPIVIPKAGETVKLSPENIALYRRLINVYENNDYREENGKFYINGKESDTYTFKQNYYWAMGDNRHNSEDSRFWGYVPEDHMVGKPLFIWMSAKNGNLFDGIRWNRLFTSANKM
jgi:signal peptidase I